VPDRDASNGYEEIAPIFIAGRGRAVSGVGALEVAEWAKTLPEGATVLDLGCGTGVPISQVLLERGCKVHGVDASPSMVAAFRTRFPEAPVQCAAVECSDFFGRFFDGVVSWGLFFLLDPAVQRGLITKIAAILPSGGRLLFTSPSEICSWQDAMTGRLSVSLGRAAYEKALEEEGLSLVGTRRGVGDNFYYFAQKA
jgi:SAM-dependent methyltransferase